MSIYSAARAVYGIGDVFSDLANDVESGADAVGGAVDSIPGLRDLINGPLRDFAKTTAGQFVLNVIADNFAIGAIAKLGPAVAAIWALPGVARGDSFDKALIQGTADRLKETAEILGASAGGDAIVGQMNALTGEVLAKYGTSTALPDIETLASTFNVREDVAAIVKSQVEHFALPDWSSFDVATGRYLMNPQLSRFVSSNTNIAMRTAAAATTRTTVFQGSQGVNATAVLANLAAQTSHPLAPFARATAFEKVAATAAAAAPKPQAVRATGAPVAPKSSVSPLLIGGLLLGAAALAFVATRKRKKR